MALFNKVQCTPGDTTKWKQQAGYTTAEDYDNPDAQIVSCDAQGNKYLLDVAKVPGTQISSATGQLSTTNNQWEVILGLKSAGATAFANLTSELASKYYSAGGGNPANSDYWLATVAITLDGNVVSAPEITEAIPGGSAQITGSFTQAQATQLANVLEYGSLPLNFKILTADSVSPTLGKAQLTAGLLAAAIGLGLVVIYSFLYYRGLGIVSVSSLAIAGLLALLSVILLSKYQNFHLELAGIAGLIVAIGITADSFVVFFERLRDEVREGKQLRPAVEARLEAGPAHDPGLRHGVVHRGAAAVLLLDRRGQGLRVHPRPDHPHRRGGGVPVHQADGDPARPDQVLRRRPPDVRAGSGPARRPGPVAVLGPSRPGPARAGRQDS